MAGYRPEVPEQARVRFQLAFAYYARQDYPAAIQKFAEAARVGPPRADLLLDWGLSYAALHETDKALEKLNEAAALTPRRTYIPRSDR